MRLPRILSFLACLLLWSYPASPQFNGTSGIYALNHMWFGVNTASITTVTPGTGYAIGDTVTLDCPNTSAFVGPNTVRPVITVATLSGSAIATYTWTLVGVATTIPTTGLAGGLNGVCTFTQYSTSGSGSGLTLYGNFSFQGAPGASGGGSLPSIAPFTQLSNTSPTATQLPSASARSTWVATDLGMTANTDADNSPFLSALISAQGNPPNTGQGGYHITFPALPNVTSTEYYFSSAYKNTAKGQIDCGGGGFYSDSVFLIFAAGQDGIDDFGGLINGCTIASLGQWQGQITTGSQTINAAGPTIAYNTVPATVWGPNDGFVAIPRWQERGLAVPAGSFLDAVSGSTFTIDSAFVPTQTCNNTSVATCAIFQLPAALTYNVNTTTSSPTVTVVSGPTNFQLTVGDWIWLNGFPFGAKVHTISGTGYPYTLTIMGVIDNGVAVNSTVTYTGATGKMWRLPAAIARYGNGRAIYNSGQGFVIGTRMDCGAFFVGCNDSFDQYNTMFENMIGRTTFGDDTGASTSIMNVYAHNYWADIIEGGTVGSVYLGDNSNSGEAIGSQSVLHDCYSDNETAFVGMYVGKGDGDLYGCFITTGAPADSGGLAFGSTHDVGAIWIAPEQAPFFASIMNANSIQGVMAFTNAPDNSQTTATTSTVAPNAVTTGYIVGTTYNVSSVVSGTLAVGQILGGTAVTDNTIIVSGSGTTWTVNNSQTVGSVGSPVSITAAETSTAAFTGSISATTLSTSAVTGTIAIGQTVGGSGVSAGTIITAGSGSSWTVYPSQTVGSTSMVSGAVTLTYSAVPTFVYNSIGPGGIADAAGGLYAIDITSQQLNQAADKALFTGTQITWHTSTTTTLSQAPQAAGVTSGDLINMTYNAGVTVSPCIAFSGGISTGYNQRYSRDCSSVDQTTLSWSGLDSTWTEAQGTLLLRKIIGFDYDGSGYVPPQVSSEAFPSGILLGNQSNGTWRLFDSGTLSPTNNSTSGIAQGQVQGNVRFNMGMTAGGTMGWCDTAAGLNFNICGPISNSATVPDYTMHAVRSGTASNTDLTGRITLSGGAGTFALTETYTSAPNCITADVTTPANASSVSESTSTLTFTGTGTDILKYICAGRN